MARGRPCASCSPESTVDRSHRDGGYSRNGFENDLLRVAGIAVLVTGVLTTVREIVFACKP